MYKVIRLLPILLLFTIVFGVFLRLYELPRLFHFTYDEEVFAFVGKRMFINHHIPLIGGVTPQHVHLAPYFYWISGIFLFISHLNPIGWGVAAAALAGFTMIALFYTGKELFGSKVGLIATFIYSFSFYQNIFDRHYWGLAFNALVSILTILCLSKIISGKHKYLLLLVGTLGFGLNTDPSTIVLLLLAIVSFFIFKIRISKKWALMSICFFIVIFVPLIIFDLRHQFANSKGIFQYIEELKTGKSATTKHSARETIEFLPKVLLRTLYVFGDTDLAKQYSYCSQHANGRLRNVPSIIAYLVLVVVMVSLFYVWKRTKKNNATIGLRIILILFGVTQLGVLIYGGLFHGDIYDHYVTTLFPAFYLLIAFILVRLLGNQKWILVTLLLVFSGVNLSLLNTVHHRFGYADKAAAVSWIIKETKGKDFSLDSLGSCFRYNGYRYLFYIYGHEPAKSFVDANFTHLYDKAPSMTHPPLLAVITNPDWTETQEYWDEYQNYERKLIKRAQFGAIEVLLIDNSNLDFVGKY